MSVGLTIAYQGVLAPGDIKIMELSEMPLRHARPVRLWFWRSQNGARARRMFVPSGPFEILGVEYDGSRAMIGPARVTPDDRGTPWELSWPMIDREAPKIMVRARDGAVGISIEVECVAAAVPSARGA